MFAKNLQVKNTDILFRFESRHGKGIRLTELCGQRSNTTSIYTLKANCDVGEGKSKN